MKKYRDEHKDKLSQERKSNNVTNKAAITVKQKEYECNNKTAITAKQKLYRSQNKPKISERKAKNCIENKEGSKVAVQNPGKVKFFRDYRMHVYLAICCIFEVA